MFSTPAAEELHALLAACLDPSRETIIRSAAATHLVGATAEALATLSSGDPRLEALPLILSHLAEVWQREGIAAWWYQTADTDLGWGTPRLRLAGLGDHGRMAMDVLHLVELLAKAAGEQALPAPGLLEWLEQHRAGASDENDDAQRRLERDDPAVRLVTVHASKGLQYPIVFEAFAWIPAKLSDHGGLVHPGDGIDADRHLGEWPEDVVPQAQREVLGDDLRKLYVGLTRAMHRLYVLWVPVASAKQPSALAWLLAGRTAPDAATMSLAVPADGGASDDDPFTRLKHRTALGVDLPDLPEVAVVAIPAEQAVETSPRPPAPAPTEHPTDPRPTLDLERILRRWQRSSFTGLARFAEREETQDGLDHDAAATPAAGATDVDEAPGGAALGSLVHRLYEHGDFPRWRSEPGHLAPLLRSHAAQDGVLLTEPQIARLAQHCRATVVEPVPALGLALADLPARAVAREWPIRLGIPRPSPGLGRLLAGHVPEAPAWPATLGPAVIPAGVFTGVLDALVHVDGRYHVIDWKTNRLPGYAPADLVQAMADEHYFLQAHLYLLAVHRFLRFRRPDYDPARHLGGAHYAFLRGSDAPGGGWFTVAARPDLLEACDAAF